MAYDLHELSYATCIFNTKLGVGIMGNIAGYTVKETTIYSALWASLKF